MILPPGFFSTDLFWSCLKWLMILLIWAIFALSIWRENKSIKHRLSSTLEEQKIIALFSILHKRDMYIWLQVTLLLVIVAANDIHQAATSLTADFFSPPVIIKAAEVKRVPETIYDSALKKNAATAIPYSDITEFNEKNSKQQAYIDWLKERYESWLISYYYLQKCSKTGADDYDVIHKALIRDLSAAQSDGLAEGNILMAAAGSYKEMYSEIPCDAAHITSTKAGYDANMQQARKGQQGKPSSKPAPAAVKPDEATR